MLRLTRLNNQPVAINPDHIAWVDSSPDTTLCLLGGDKILVRESLDELVDQVVAFRRAIRTPTDEHVCFPTDHGDTPRAIPQRSSQYPRPQSSAPRR